MKCFEYNVKKDNKLLIQLIDFENSKYNKNAIWLWNIIILVDIESRDFKFIWLVSEFFKWLKFICENCVCLLKLIHAELAIISA